MLSNEFHSSEPVVLPTLPDQAREFVQAIDAAAIRQPPDAQCQLWRHQAEAAEAFLAIGHGVLEMATGTGKTRTAMRIMTALDAEGKLDAVVVATTGTDLLDQWGKTVDAWALACRPPFRVLRHYERHHDGNEFASGPERSLLLVSRDALPQVLRQLPAEERARMLIVHDEVHGLGSPKTREALGGEHAAFGYRLGLSATPEREYDEAGSDFIRTEIGEVVYAFGLHEAIRRGVLCEFDYIPLPYELSDGDRARLKKVHHLEAIRRKEGRPMTKEEVWIELAKVYKTAERKPGAFAEYLRADADVLRSCIIFVEDKAFGERVLPLLHPYTFRYRTYYAEDERRNLAEFARGKLDCLITCHRLSQGIDIPRLRAVVLFSAASAKLETIQRLGRCLRVDPAAPGKRATVVDFVRSPDARGQLHADEVRAAWLEDLARTRRED